MSAQWEPPPAIPWTLADGSTFTGTLAEAAAHLEHVTGGRFQRWPDGAPVVDTTHVAEPHHFQENP